MSSTFPTLEWVGDHHGYLRLLDQTRLPGETVYLECRTPEDVWQAIRRLSVRGAPAIGVAAAFGVCLGVQGGQSIDEVCDYLATSRPTAVNLFWAIERMRRAASQAASGPELAERTCAARPDLSTQLLAEARAIQNEDREQCIAMGCHGADLLADLPAGPGLLTHCNTGALATGAGDGTALGVIFELARRGARPQVWVDETRPLLQGARLTAWELQQRGIEATLICDSVAAQVMREGRVHAALVGADRIAANGDTANKIGTLSVAALARTFGVPFYVVAPRTTFDLSIPSGNEIPIEKRSTDEVTHGFGQQTAPEGIAVYNPAFDVTPAELISAIVTDRGVIRPVNAETVAAVVC